MPDGLHRVDSTLPPDFWSQMDKLIRTFGGRLRPTIKEIHHIQIAPPSLFTEKKTDDEILELGYFPGDIYSFDLIFDAVAHQKEIELSEDFIVASIDTDEIAQNYETDEGRGGKASFLGNQLKSWEKFLALNLSRTFT